MPHKETDPATGFFYGFCNRTRALALRAFLVARSRYAEDQLAHGIDHGITQYVLLGAGLDTFAYRNPYPQLEVFEVDHPATQQWKLELLDRNNIPIPSNLTCVPLDFEAPDYESEASEHQTLRKQLLAAGFNPRARTLFSWLGVVPYLTLPAFRATLGFIAAQPLGSAVVFDYGQPRAALPFFEQLAHDSLAARVQLSGEPFQLFFTPAQIAAELTPFRAMEDLDSSQINARYFTHRSDLLATRGTAGRLISAWL